MWPSVIDSFDRQRCIAWASGRAAACLPFAQSLRRRRVLAQSLRRPPSRRRADGLASRVHGAHDMKPTQTVGRYMTSSPHTIGVDQTLAVAADIMRTHQIRHLPVLRSGQLVGVLSERDLQLVAGLPNVDPATVKVEEAMSEGVYTASPETPIVDVAAQMATHKYGAALVTDRGRVVGVFTTIDALRALAHRHWL
jgi:acetoin utilization protein AcuB